MLRIAYLLAVLMVPIVAASELAPAAPAIPSPATPNQSAPSQNNASWKVYESKAESVGDDRDARYRNSQNVDQRTSSEESTQTTVREQTTLHCKVTVMDI